MPEQHQADIDAGSLEPETPAGGVVPPTPGSSGGRSRSEKREPQGGRGADVNPMDFWRSGRSRSARQAPAPGGGIRNRLQNMYFPPWLPVVGIIVLVFGILGLLFVTRSATGAPRSGEDHWHATYTYYVCGEKQPNAPTWEGVGVHTHGDGVVHIHPFSPPEEGQGARLTKWFDYGGGKLDGDEIRLPGLSVTWKNGDECPEGTPDAGQEGEVQVFVNSEKLSDWSRYIPKDGDVIRLIFGPAEDLIQLTDRQVIDEGQASTEETITVTGTEGATTFTPATISVRSGEAVKIILINDSDVSHGLRIAGPNGTYDDGDDFLVVPDGADPADPGESGIIEPGGQGFVVVRLDNAGTIEFKDPTASDANGEPYAVGTIIVEEEGSATPAPEDSFDQEAAITAADDGWDPAEITLEVGVRFGVTITNDTGFLRNIRVAGPDGEFETEDDIVSEDAGPGDTGILIGQLDDLGDYEFRDDYHHEFTGTIVISNEPAPTPTPSPSPSPSPSPAP